MCKFQANIASSTYLTNQTRVIYFLVTHNETIVNTTVYLFSGAIYRVAAFMIVWPNSYIFTLVVYTCIVTEN